MSDAASLSFSEYPRHSASSVTTSLPFSPFLHSSRATEEESPQCDRIANSTSDFVPTGIGLLISLLRGIPISIKSSLLN